MISSFHIINIDLREYLEIARDKRSQEHKHDQGCP